MDQNGLKKMKLYDLLQMFASLDEDTSDSIYDAVVTICWDRSMAEGTDPYDQFFTALIKNVDTTGFNVYETLICDWSALCEKHIEDFNDFFDFGCSFNLSNANDRGDFLYNCVNELHKLVAGYGTDSMYKKLVQILNK